MSDTAEQPALAPKGDEGTVVALIRVAGGLELLASVLAAFPEKNPDVWHGADWSKQLRDLTLACEHLRQHARQLEDIAGALQD